MKPVTWNDCCFTKIVSIYFSLQCSRVALYNCNVHIAQYREKWKYADHLLLPHIIKKKRKKEVRSYIPCLIVCMIFEEKYIYYILLTDQI